MNNNGYKSTIIIGSIIAVLIIAVSVIFALRPDDKKNTRSSTEPSPSAAPEGSEHESGSLTTVFDGIITGIDLDSSCLTINELGSDIPHTLYYTGATDIRTRRLHPISAALLQKGDIAVVSYSEDRLISLIGSDMVWSYKNAGNLIIDSELEKMTLGTEVYRYDNSLKILDSDEFIGLSDISSLDTLNIYGIDDHIYLIRIATGHGTLSFANDSDFINGTLSYNKGKTVTFTENMRLTLAEGEYDIRVENGDFTASATIKISRNKNTCFDLFDYGAKPMAYGNVNFKISPLGSDLYIDGIKTGYSEPVRLSFGEHSIEVSLGGYTSYFGTVTVDKTDTTKNIVLSEAPQIEKPDEDMIYTDSGLATEDNVPTASPAPTPTDIPGSDGSDSVTKDDVNDSIPDSTTDDGDMDTLEVIDGDSDEQYPDEADDKSEPAGQLPSDFTEGTMTVYTTTGTKVYADGILAGVTADGCLSMPKPSGTVIITFEKEGYATKHYTITPDPEESEVFYRFPEMTELRE